MYPTCQDIFHFEQRMSQKQAICRKAAPQATDAHAILSIFGRKDKRSMASSFNIYAFK